MTRPFVLFAMIVVAFVSLAAWGDESQLPEPDASAADASEPTAPRVWALWELRQACNAYTEWDPELEDCVRTEEPLPPELELFEGRILVRPMESTIVLYPDGAWTEEAACLPDLLEETFFNNWRFCRDPERNDRIPPLWQLPVNGIPYEEVEEIFAANQDALMAIDGVSSVGLGANGILVHTSKPELVPEEVEEVPIRILAPLIIGNNVATDGCTWRRDEYGELVKECRH